MLIYTNQSSKKTRKQKLKQKAAWNKQQAAYRVETTKKPFIAKKPLSIVILRPGADTYKEIKSLETTECDVFKREEVMYTGDAMIGISTMHKSNAVPVFSSDHAKDISKMRRG